MIEQCYKEIAKKLGVNEYKVLADIYRIFYTDKFATKDLYDKKKIGRELYDHIMKNFPSKKDTKRIFKVPGDVDLPTEVDFYREGAVVMVWKINGNRGRNNDLPAVVSYSTLELYESTNYNNYLLRRVWYKDGKIGRDGDKPHIIDTRYINNIQTDEVTKEWRSGTSCHKIAENSEKIIDEWVHCIYGGNYRGKDLPAKVTTFKATGKQRSEWYSQKITQDDETGPCREKDKPCVIDEEGTQFWSLCKYRYNYNNPSIFIGREGGKPAVIKTDGTKMWYHDGEIHSLDDKPAVIKGDGTMMWYNKGAIHRENNPAIVYPDGREEWWTHGMKREERDILKVKLKNDDVVNKIMRMI